ncbi:CRP-like cAMP-binding protein [Neorhizobium sp. 2083]|uniref:Crp/Fnr family transcriptional regulator n=1 Tax=Neorhizobium sp. 2083 TaxID=2817762 RepID=UPI00285FCC3D|nr:Crp/Fnr family transcriptional regulator [Neorhizobium sp. 2083]MDR6821082.1 CRP-like cAMP-binding protein [Neorhizobium sp. 2083]
MTGTRGILKTNNILLSLLSDQDQAVLIPSVEEIELRQNDVLFQPSQEIEHVYFFNSGLSSEIAVNADGSQIEVGCAGREGMSGVPAILGVRASPHQSFMQVGGSALRIHVRDLQRIMVQNPQLAGLLLRYAHVFMAQIAATALANGRYKVEQRLARWLLMSHDRLDGDLPLTHGFLALMLGVRRPSVTDTLHVLEGEKLIKASRSLITIRQREKLQTMAGDAYGVPEAEYQRLISTRWPNQMRI